jgi:osmoprotectant transport system substrate-binding protein
VYAPAPIVREEVLKLHPEIETALAPVFQSLTVEVLRELNARTQLGGESAHDVARAYLLEKGFISK